MRQSCHWVHALPALLLLLLCLPPSGCQQVPPQDGVCLFTNKTSTQVTVPVVVSTRGRYCDWWGNCRYYISYRTTYRLSTKNLTLSGKYCCPGYRPQDGRCLLGCPLDRWGANCAELCTCNVTTQTCDDVTGTCFCRPGFESGDCQVPGGNVGGRPSGGTVAAIVLMSLLLLAAALLLLLLLRRRGQLCRSQGKHSKQRPTVPQRPAGRQKNAAYDSGRGSLAEGEVEMVSHAELDLARGATPVEPGESIAGRESMLYQHLHQPPPPREGASNQLYHHLAPPADGRHSTVARSSGTDFAEAYDVAGIRPVIGADPNDTYHQLRLPPS